MSISVFGSLPDGSGKAKRICECENQAAETGYLKTGVFSLAKSRIFWLMALMISGMITGTILARYESAFAAVPMLVTFIPMLTDTGGNAGSQSSTMVIRAMAMGEINIRNLLLFCGKKSALVFWLEQVLEQLTFSDCC